MSIDSLKYTLDHDSAEAERLLTLESYDILDTPYEVMFDELARMAASLCDTPIALVSLVDGRRQWFKANVGLDAKETPRELAFCAHAIAGSEPFIVPNALGDPRFATNSLVTSDPAIRFYAGVPLIAPNGKALGTLCVIDKEPRALGPHQIEGLMLLSRHVMAQIELRKRFAALRSDNDRCERQIGTLLEKNDRLDALVGEQEAEIDLLAHHNVQTSLANRALFIKRLDQQLQSTILGDGPITAFVLDIQRFALVREAIGQRHLDAFLRQVAQRLVRVIGTSHEVAHLESDRFAAFTLGASSVATSVAFLEERLLPALNSPYTVDDQELRVAFTAGIALTPIDDMRGETLLRCAKTALEKAKESNDTYAVFSPELKARMAGVVSLETKLRRAIEKEQFELYYQPKLNLMDGSVSGVEALLRWRDPTWQGQPDHQHNAWIPPARFVPALEATGLILHVGRWALARAAHDQRDWQARGLFAPRIAVNISPLQLRHKSFLAEIESILKPSGIAPALDIELTEAVLMEQPELCIGTLHALREWGVRVAIDDFGSGYSSLRYLTRLPVDSLKIDMAFVHAMTKNADNMSIVSSVISLAHALRFKTVAEGVETEEQRNLLRLLRCDEIQGYLVSKAISKTELEAFLSLSGHNGSVA